MSSSRRVMTTKDGMMALERSDKIKDLQRTLKIKSAFQKMNAEKRILSSYKEDKVNRRNTKKSNNEPEDSNYDPGLFENGFTRYDIVELNRDGETLQESVIIEHPTSSEHPTLSSKHLASSSKHPPSTSLEPQVKIKEEPIDDLFIPDMQIKEEPLEFEEDDDQEMNSFDPMDLLKIEPDDDYEINMDIFEAPRELRIEDILPPGATYEPLKLKPHIERKRLRDNDDYEHGSKPKRKAHAGGLECDICGKKFSYFRSFRQHRIDHTFSNNEVMCAICQKMIKPAALDYHMNYKHSEERKFQCRLCGRRFKSPGAMRHHEVTQHRDDDKFQFECKQCNKYFDSMEHLEKHVKTFHMPILAVKIEKVNCEYCNENFANSSQLRLHIGVLGKLGKCRNTIKKAGTSKS